MEKENANLVLVLTEIKNLSVGVVRVETQFKELCRDVKRIGIDGHNRGVMLESKMEDIKLSLKQEETARIKRDDDLESKITSLKPKLFGWTKRKISTVLATISALGAGIFKLWEVFG